MAAQKIALGIFAHPDDAEFMCTGTLTLLRQRGWEIHIASMTPGDCGSIKHSREEISRIRKGEGAASAAILHGKYHCLECEDVFIVYDKPTILKTIKVIRQVRPDLVFTASPQDYMVDHEMTSKLVWNACFGCGIPNIDTPGVQKCDRIPYLYYADPIDAKDKFAMPVNADIYIDITTVIDTKIQMLCCHKSQREWLLAYHGTDEYTEMLKRHGEMRGSEIKVKYAEAFRQHLGHSFPQDNILKKELNNLVYIK